MLDMEFTFSKLVKMRVSTAYASRNRQGKPAFIKENEKTKKQKSKSVKFLRYTDEFFSRLMTSHYLKVASYI